MLEDKTLKELGMTEDAVKLSPNEGISGETQFKLTYGLC